MCQITEWGGLFGILVHGGKYKYLRFMLWSDDWKSIGDYARIYQGRADNEQISPVRPFLDEAHVVHS